MKNNYILIDYENVRVKSLGLLKGDQFRVWVFLGPNNTKLDASLVLEIQELRERAKYIPLTTQGSNALDFHIAYYLGALAKEDPSAFFHIISQDKGFDPLIEHLKAKKISAARSISIEEMPCFLAKKEPNTSRPGLTDEELLNLAVADLNRRKMSKPRTSKTLLSTMRAGCGKEIDEARIKKVYGNLVQRGYVKVEGTKVTYNLPLENSVFE